VRIGSRSASPRRREVAALEQSVRGCYVRILRFSPKTEERWILAFANQAPPLILASVPSVPGFYP
jgi:hypothetical protein